MRDTGAKEHHGRESKGRGGYHFARERDGGSRETLSFYRPGHSERERYENRVSKNVRVASEITQNEDRKNTEEALVTLSKSDRRFVGHRVQHLRTSAIEQWPGTTHAYQRMEAPVSQIRADRREKGTFRSRYPEARVGNIHQSGRLEQTYQG